MPEDYLGNTWQIVRGTVEEKETFLQGALRELRDGLTRLDVAIVGIEAKEEPAIDLPPSLEYRD